MTETTSRHAFNGRLILSDGTPVRVAISDTGEIIRLLVVHDASLLHDQPLENLVLESHGGSGVIHDRGRGEWTDSQTIHFERDAAPDIVQRRDHVRVTAPQVVTLSDEDGNELLVTQAVNLSGGGMLLALPLKFDTEPLLKADVLNFELVLNEASDPVVGELRVIRVDAARGQLAVEYQAISHRERERVIKFIFDRQRTTIALSRVRWL